MDRDAFDYQVALRDCQEKLAALPDRLKAEFDAALEERREPFNIQPVTLIRADLVCAAIKKIGDKTDDPDRKLGLATFGQVLKDQARACARMGKEIVGLNSDHLLAILEAAKVVPEKEAAVAPIQG